MRLGVAVRFSGSAETCYVGSIRGQSGNRNVIDKVVAGTLTNLALGNTAPSGASGDTVRLEISGSDLDLKLNGTSHLTVTNSDVGSGNVRCGIWDRTGNTSNQWDDFEAADLAVSGVARSQAVIIG